MDRLQQKVFVIILYPDKINDHCMHSYSGGAKRKDTKRVVLITTTVCGAAIFIIILGIFVVLRGCFLKQNQLQPRSEAPYEDPDSIWKFRMVENIVYAHAHVK